METIPLLQEADRDRLVGPGMTGATCINLLNGLAWMGELSKEQIHRIWFPDYSVYTVRNALQQLQCEGLIRQINWNYKHQDQENPEKKPEKPAPGKPPNRRKVLYTLVDDRLELIRSHTMYPLKPRGKGQKRYRDHDYHSNEAITYAILHGRQQQVRMSGLFLFYEYFLNPPHRRPCSDALVIVHTREKGYASHNLVHVPEKRPAYFWYHMHHGGTTIQGERLMMVGRHPQAIPIAAADEKMGNFQEAVLVPWTRYAGTSDEGRTLWDTTCGHFQKRSFLATITGFVLFRFTSEFQTFTDRRGYGEFARVEVTGSGGTGRVPRDPRG